MTKLESQIAFMRDLVHNKGECNWAGCGPTKHGLVCKKDSCPIFKNDAVCYKGNAKIKAKEWLQKNVIASNLELI